MQHPSRTLAAAIPIASRTSHKTIGHLNELGNQASHPLTWKSSPVQLERPEPVPEREDTKHEQDPRAKQTKPCQHRSENERVAKVGGDDGAKVR